VVRRLIVDSLRYWVESMHVDGFRFDLASILSRDESGQPIANPPVLFDIETDPVLAGTKLIAEAWDAAGLYRVGGFVGDFWQEWNGRFHDDVRAFVKGDWGTVPGLASRLLGSPDLYGHEEREAEQSINFVTCHDGFTLNDLVSYDHKHNEANGEDNRDGANDNRSWNCGVEGPSADPGIEALRQRQVKSFLAINLLALGTPMILMGDEVRRTQQGNNNAYCHDNELNWLDWSVVERHRDVRMFVRALIALRLRRELSAGEHPVVGRRLRHAGPARAGGCADLACCGNRGRGLWPAGADTQRVPWACGGQQRYGLPQGAGDPGTGQNRPPLVGVEQPAAQYGDCLLLPAG